MDELGAVHATSSRLRREGRSWYSGDELDLLDLGSVAIPAGYGLIRYAAFAEDVQMALELRDKQEALICLYQNQTELLYRMTMIDLRVFSGYITLQLAFGAWLFTNVAEVPGSAARVGLFCVDLALTVVAMAFLYNSLQRRNEVVAIVRNCNRALGYETPGAYLDDASLNVATKFRRWAPWYYFGVVAAIVGVSTVLFSVPAAAAPLY